LKSLQFISRAGQTSCGSGLKVDGNRGSVLISGSSALNSRWEVFELCWTVGAAGTYYGELLVSLAIGWEDY